MFAFFPIMFNLHSIANENAKSTESATPDGVVSQEELDTQEEDEYKDILGNGTLLKKVCCEISANNCLLAF